MVKGGSNMKKVKRKSIIVTLLLICMVINTIGSSVTANAANSGKWIDLGQGWEFRVDPPHNDNANAKYHVHVRNKQKGIEGSEGVDGSASHGDHMNKVPNSVKKKIKDHEEYKKGKEKQKKLDKAVQEVKSKKLDLSKAADVVIAIGIVVACTATFFFPGDDVAAWANLLRTLGC